MTNDTGSTHLNTLEEWRKTRRAIVHTIDVSPKHSKHAQETVVKGFKKGMYFHNVDFHVSDNVSAWLQQRADVKITQPDSAAPLELADSLQYSWGTREVSHQFLHRALVDIPSSEKVIGSISKHLKFDALLTVWAPNITQIVDCVTEIRQQRLPLHMESVWQLGSGDRREWEVKAVKTREGIKIAKARGRREMQNGEWREEEKSEAAPNLQMASIEREDSVSEEERYWTLAEASSEGATEETEEAQWKMICRPKVQTLRGIGGFLGVWRRMNFNP
jgi:tRNA (adenine57-N1/adenine58-N1)-methyltransferase catalytic subunit